MITVKELERIRWTLAEMMRSQFVVRPDVYARQFDDGSYRCIRQPFTNRVMYQHLKGEITTGTYVLDPQGNARFTVLDADSDEEFTKLKEAAWKLDSEGVPTYLELSRRGGHLWLFYKDPVPARVARNLGLGLVHANDLSMEVFPKQEKGNPGSCIRTPLGVHRKSGMRYDFIQPNGMKLGSMRRQLEMICAPETVPLDAVEYYIYHEPERPAKPHQVSPDVENLKDIPLGEFIGQYIDLKPIATGFIGLCPFHDDSEPSLGINSRENYFHCFACGTAGDIFSFWMKYKNLDFKTALSELERMYEK